MNNKKILYDILMVIPFFFGFFGYLQFYQGDYLDAMYFSINNYFLGYTIKERSLLLELSRWGGLLVTTSVVLKILEQIFSITKNKFILLFNKDLIAVYGCESKTKYLIKSLEYDKKNI